MDTLEEIIDEYDAYDRDHPEYNKEDIINQVLIEIDNDDYSKNVDGIQLLRSNHDNYLEKLLEINGIGISKATRLLSCIELGKRIYLKKPIIHNKLTTPEEIYESTKYIFNGLKQEYFYCLYFNSKQELINKKLLFVGTINQSITHPREVFKEAYKVSAYSIVCMHNHPSNNVYPSKEDIRFTNSLLKISKLQGIPLLDHIIVGENTYYSFYENNMLTIDNK